MTIKKIDDIRDQVRRQKHLEHWSEIDKWRPEGYRDRDDTFYQTNVTPPAIKAQRWGHVLIWGGALVGVISGLMSISPIVNDDIATLRDGKAQADDRKVARERQKVSAAHGTPEFYEQLHEVKSNDERVSAKALTVFKTSFGFIAIGLSIFGMQAMMRRWPTSRRLAKYAASESEILQMGRQLLQTDQSMALEPYFAAINERRAVISDIDDAIAACKAQRERFPDGSTEQRDMDTITANYRRLRESSEKLLADAQHELESQRATVANSIEIQIGHLQLALINLRHPETMAATKAIARAAAPRVDSASLMSDATARISVGDDIETLDMLAGMPEALTRKI